jgi:predicted ATPase
MVGELIGEGATKEQTVVGETPNLAARLQTLAPPGGVVISRATRRLVGGLFELADLKPRRLKSFAAAVTAWRVAGEGRAEGRFEALHGEHLTPLVGREHELGILLERWAWAKDGDGQVILISGEPGIGKSRVVRTLREHLDNEPHTLLGHYCSPYHTKSAFFPVIGLLKRAERFDRDDPPEGQLAKLKAVIARSSDRPDEVVPLFGPEVQKRRTLQALVDQLAGLAAQQPVLALYEDVHWIDPSTLELLGLVVERVRQLPVLVLITFRPEFQPPWTGHTHVTTLTMSRLGRRQGADLIARVAGDKALPAAVVQQIVARTDGVPLFIEELTKAVLEAGGTGRGTEVPASLHASLIARLDRVAGVKEVAQVAACIGREFAYSLIAAVSPLPEAELKAALDRLVAAELVFSRSTAPEPGYTFKHALLRDATHESLLKAQRQQLHGRIASVLEERFPETVETEPELLAQHYTAAGLHDQAIDYWHRAGQRASERSANWEAIAHLTEGLELIATLREGLELIATRPDAPEHLKKKLQLLLIKELRLLLAIGGPLMATKGYASPEVELTYNRALVLCDQLDRSEEERFPVRRGLGNCYYLRGQFQRAHGLAKELVQLAQGQGPLRCAHACRALGSARFFLGRLADASEQFEFGIKLDGAVKDVGEHRDHARLHGEHPGVFCRVFLAWALWLRGYPDGALEKAKAGLDFSQWLALPHSFALAQTLAAVLYNWRGEFEMAVEHAKTGVELAGEHSLRQVLGFAIMAQGVARVGLGQQADGIDQIHSGLVAWNETGARLSETQWLGLLAEADVQTGQLDQAIAALDRATATSEATGECHYRAELHRLRGTALAHAGNQDEAAACLQEAIDTARSQQAKSLELRAAMSLARLRRCQGRRAEAHDLLAPVYLWFTQGSDTADLKDAKALLDELA